MLRWKIIDIYINKINKQEWPIIFAVTDKQNHLFHFSLIFWHTKKMCLRKWKSLWLLSFVRWWRRPYTLWLNDIWRDRHNKASMFFDELTGKKAAVKKIRQERDTIRQHYVWSPPVAWLLSPLPFFHSTLCTQNQTGLLGMWKKKKMWNVRKGISSFREASLFAEGVGRMFIQRKVLIYINAKLGRCTLFFPQWIWQMHVHNCLWKWCTFLSRHRTSLPIGVQSNVYDLALSLRGFSTNTRETLGFIDHCLCWHRTYALSSRRPSLPLQSFAVADLRQAVHYDSIRQARCTVLSRRTTFRDVHQVLPTSLPYIGVSNQ